MIREAFRENSRRRIIYEKGVSGEDEGKKHQISQRCDIDEGQEK